MVTFTEPFSERVKEDPRVRWRERLTLNHLREGDTAHLFKGDPPTLVVLIEPPSDHLLNSFMYDLSELFDL